GFCSLRRALTSIAERLGFGWRAHEPRVRAAAHGVFEAGLAARLRLDPSLALLDPHAQAFASELQVERRIAIANEPVRGRDQHLRARPHAEVGRSGEL